MGKQLEVDQKLVEVLKRRSYEIEDVKNEENGHYCLNINAIEDEDVDNEEGTIYTNDEYLALYLQANGFGDVKQAQIDILEKVKDYIPNYRRDIDKDVVESFIDELINELKK